MSANIGRGGLPALPAFHPYSPFSSFRLFDILSAVSRHTLPAFSLRLVRCPLRLVLHLQHLLAVLHHLLHVPADELQHVRLLVVALAADFPVAQPVLAAEALQRPLAGAQHLAQILVVVQPFPVHVLHPGGILVYQHRDDSVLTVKPLHDALHPCLELLPCHGLRVFPPDGFPPGLAAVSRARPATGLFHCHCVHNCIP